MKFKIEIDCENAAFEGDPKSEIIMLIKDFAGSLGTIMRCNDLSYGRYPLRDVNGNTVGHAWIEK